jgi:hypothetical protein
MPKALQAPAMAEKDRRRRWGADLSIPEVMDVMAKIGEDMG